MVWCRMKVIAPPDGLTDPNSGQSMHCVALKTQSKLLSSWCIAGTYLFTSYANCILSRVTTVNCLSELIQMGRTRLNALPDSRQTDLVRQGVFYAVISSSR